MARCARSSASPWPVTPWLVGLALGLAACGGIPTGDSSAPGEQRDEGDAGEPEPCEPAAFRPARLPWSDTVGEPDSVVLETDEGWGEGVTSMWWWEHTPARKPDGAGNWPWLYADDPEARYIILQRGVDADVLSKRGVDVDAEEPDGTVRGHPAVLTATGDPGVGGASVRWAEGEQRCDHYLLILQPWQTEAEMWAIVPQR